MQGGNPEQSASAKRIVAEAADKKRRGKVLGQGKKERSRLEVDRCSGLFLYLLATMHQKGGDEKESEGTRKIKKLKKGASYRSRKQIKRHKKGSKGSKIAAPTTTEGGSEEEKEIKGEKNYKETNLSRMETGPGGAGKREVGCTETKGTSASFHQSLRDEKSKRRRGKKESEKWGTFRYKKTEVET